MSADIKDFQSYLEKKRVEAIGQQEAATQIAQATALHVEHVTQDPEWNIYLQKLQPHVDRAEATRDQLRNDIFKAMPPEVRESLTSTYWRTVGFLEALDIAMKLPKVLLDESRGRA